MHMYDLLKQLLYNPCSCLWHILKNHGKKYCIGDLIYNKEYTHVFVLNKNDRSYKENKRSQW